MAISEVKKRKKKKYLPSEVVTNIFARLPLETIGNVMLVNKFCLKLISNPAFPRAHLKQTKMPIPTLPPKILSIIFSRLPIETLRNVLLVNKVCRRLISTRAFSRAHLKLSKQGKTTNLSDCKLISILITSRDGLEKKATQFSLASLLSNSNSINVVDLDYPKNGLKWPRVYFEGSCDGLVCLVLNEKYVFLWNPCTGKYRKLPRLHPNNGSLDDFTFGLGYDKSKDDFKVVAFCSKSYKSHPEEWLSYEVYVCSLKKNSWKRIHQDLKCNVPGPSSGKFISGQLHWLSGGCIMDDTKKIVSFDVESEVFGIVEPPSNFKDGCCDMILDVLEGCICLLISYEERKYVDLWVLKEYGVNESWTKVVTISCVGIFDCCKFRATVLQNDEILFHSGKSFAVYNPKEDSFRFPGIRRLNHIGPQSVFYVPSLLSPDAYFLGSK